MKNSAMAVLIFTGLTGHAQRIIEESTAYQNELVEMSFDLASSIEVKTWDKPSILVQASVETEYPEHEDQFQIQVTKSRSKIMIASNSLEIFEEDEKDRIIMSDQDDFEFNYTVYIPKGIKLEVSSIIGSVTSKYLQGDISVDSVTGNIAIKKFEGDLKLKTVTGKISLPVKNSSFKAKTVMGVIYANADPGIQKADKFVGQEMSLYSEATSNQLSLNTVTGDIDLQ